MARKTVLFAPTHRDFTSTLNKRVNEYFKSTGKSRYANGAMVLKTVVMFGMYWIPYALILSGITNSALLLALAIIMGLGMAGIGLSVMHDANHGAYSQKGWVNTLIGYSLNLVGASAFNWKMQHNVLHHTYTNVHDEDEDISPRGVLRLSPHTPWKPMHKYQFIYAWFLYGLMTMMWMLVNDYRRLIRYQNNGLAKKHNANIAAEWLILLTTKFINIGYILVIPLVFTSIPWYQIVTGIFILHYITGFILAIIFQPAHVIEGTEFPLPDENPYSLQTNWAVHQLRTTTNFGNRSTWFSWYVGGLNFQIEHHLFPNVCHVHYKALSKIVKATTKEFGLPYKNADTFFQALAGHGRLLKQLGVKPEEKETVLHERTFHAEQA
ncbi:MAG TPA: acyl-CoA desaturase [Ohtaekwangia sp.]|nr:acyl-CoA desaturase [Ohtaekwangia sp.]